MQALETPKKRKSRFRQTPRKSQRVQGDAAIFASDIESPSSVNKRMKVGERKTPERDLELEVPKQVEDSRLPDHQNFKPATDSQRAHREVLPFGEQPIAVAVDRSASTGGGTLLRETAFIRAVCSLLSPRNEHPVQVLPWDGDSDQVISMPKQSTALSKLYSRRGTDPRVLYSTPAFLSALKDSRLWFLLTDGQIEDDIVRDFALKSAESQMHGTACIVVVFGRADRTSPAHCDISVGVAIYAVAPDCLFLFCDTSSGTLYNMQCKGCFRTLLPSPDAQRILNPYTQWSDLPTISIEDLQRLEIPAPARVTQDEVALQERLHVDLEELYSGNIPQEDLSEIIRNDDNLKSIVLAEMTRGRGEKLQGWLQNQYKEQPTLSRERPDLGGEAQRAITDLLRYLQRDGSDQKITKLRRELRNAHQANWKRFEDILNYYHEEKEDVDDHNQRVHWASSLSEKVYERSANQGGSSYSAESMSSHSQLPRCFGVKGREAKIPPNPSYPSAPPPAEPPRRRTTSELFFPGFQRSADPQKPGFTGECMLCESKSILTLLLKTPPKISTPNFPAIGSQSALAFPLAMGSFAELDIVSNFLCCDSCALYLVRNSVSPYRETIVDALPLVPFANNEVAWLGVVSAALRGRFRTDDLPSVFIAILDCVMSKHAQKPDADGGSRLLQRTAQWASKDILDSIKVPQSLSTTFVPSIASGVSSTRFTSLLSDKTIFRPEHTLNRDIFSLRYPLPGFAVIIRLLRDRGTPRPQLELLTFHRLLYHMTEAHFRNLEASGEDVPSNLLTQLLTEPDPFVTLRPDRPDSVRAVTSLSPQRIVAHPSGLLDESSLAIFQGLEEFDAVEKQAGPATAVFLHLLRKIAPEHSSPVDIFNAIKALPSLTGVMNTPFSVTDILAAELAALHL